MPEQTLARGIETLQSALEALLPLLGAPSSEGAPGSGFAGIGELLQLSPADRLGALSKQLSDDFSSIVTLDPSSAIEQAGALFSSLGSSLDLLPPKSFAELGTRLESVRSALSSSLLDQMTSAVAAIRSIADAVPADRAGIVSGLVDRLLALLASLDGPEAKAIAAWVASIQKLSHEAWPLIEEAKRGADGAKLLVEVYQRVLSKSLDLFGYSAAKELVDFAASFPIGSGLIECAEECARALKDAESIYARAAACAGADRAVLAESLRSGMETLEGVASSARSAVRRMSELVSADLLQPGALQAQLRTLFERVLAVRLEEVQKIDDPFDALFDRIDAAIAGIDTSGVRDEVLGFFDRLQTTLQDAKLPSIPQALERQLTAIGDAVQGVQGGVMSLLQEAKQLPDRIGSAIGAACGSIGQLDASGTFRFAFEGDLEAFFARTSKMVTGDPDDPNAFSLAGALASARASFEQLLEQVAALAQPLAAQVGEAAQAASDGIAEFCRTVEALDIPGLQRELQSTVQSIADALSAVGFDVVVDPVVAEIEKNTEKLKGVDASSLNSILRAALKTALEVVIQIPFADEISAPLRDRYGEIKAVPASALSKLQRAYEDAVSRLEQLGPAALLEPIFGAFDAARRALGSNGAGALLEPLDELYTSAVITPLSKLDPGELLQPLCDRYGKLTARFARLSAGDLLGPIEAPLRDLKCAVARVDLTAPIDDMISGIDRAKRVLGEIRPSKLLAPLVAELSEIETQIDRFDPARLFQPVVELAAPLLGMLEQVQAESARALYELFQAPLGTLDRLKPESMSSAIRSHVDELRAGLDALNVPGLYGRLKSAYFDLTKSVEAANDPARRSLLRYLDPDPKLARIVAAYVGLVRDLERVTENVQAPDVDALYRDVQQRLLDLLPPFARKLLDPETFKGIMRLANPARFLDALSSRFQALKSKLIPISPADVAGGLDESYEAVCALLEQLDAADALEALKERLAPLKEAIDGLRIDFLAADLDKMLAAVAATMRAFDPASIQKRLGGLHADVMRVVQEALPSRLLSALDEPLAALRDALALIDPRTRLGAPLAEAWKAVEAALAGFDIASIVSPLIERLDEIEREFEDSLKRVESAFDRMLAAARGIL